MKNMRQTPAGTTVIEILMAITILLIGMTGIMALFPMGVKLTQQSLDDSLSAMTAQNALADLRAQTHLLERLMPYSTDYPHGDTLFWNATSSISNGMDGCSGSVINVGGGWLKETKIEPSLSRSGTEVSASIPRDGLAAWFDAGGSMVFSSDNNIQTWSDRSGTGHDATITWNSEGAPTYVADTLNGRPVVRFGTDSPTLGASLRFTRIAAIGTIFWVLQDKCTNTTHTHFLLGGTAEQYAFNRGTHPAGNTAYIWNPTNTAQALLTGKTYLNGTLLASPAATSLPLNQFCIVSAVCATGQFVVNCSSITRDEYGSGNGSWYGDIAEIIIYNRQLTDTEERSVGSYLSTKYGMTNTSYPAASTADAANMFTTKENSAPPNNDRSLMLITHGKALWKLYRLDAGSTFSPPLLASTGHSTNFPADGVTTGDTFNLIGTRDIDHVWVTAPANFYNNSTGRYVLGKGAAEGYGYLAIIERMEGSQDAFRVYILVYKNYDESLPPEANAPAIACYTTILPSQFVQ